MNQACTLTPDTPIYVVDTFHSPLAPPQVGHLCDCCASWSFSQRLGRMAWWHWCRCTAWSRLDLHNSQIWYQQRRITLVWGQDSH